MSCYTKYHSTELALLNIQNSLNSIMEHLKISDELSKRDDKIIAFCQYCGRRLIYGGNSCYLCPECGTLEK